MTTMIPYNAAPLPAAPLPMPQSQADLANLVMMALAGDPRAMQLLQIISRHMMQQRGVGKTPEAPKPDYKPGPGYNAAKPAPTPAQCANEDWLLDHPEAQQECMNPQKKAERPDDQWDDLVYRATPGRQPEEPQQKMPYIVDPNTPAPPPVFQLLSLLFPNGGER